MQRIIDLVLVTSYRDMPKWDDELQSDMTALVIVAMTRLHFGDSSNVQQPPSE